MNDEMVRNAIGRLHSSATRLLRDTRGGNGGGVSGARLSALTTIARAGPLSLAQLAASERVSAPTMSRLVESLVRDRLVTRETTEQDRRSVRIAVTNKGTQLIDEAQKSQTGALASRFRRLGDSEQRALVRGIELLERLTT